LTRPWNIIYQADETLGPYVPGKDKPPRYEELESLRVLHWDFYAFTPLSSV
jgi:hypothetical protein